MCLCIDTINNKIKVTIFFDHTALLNNNMITNTNLFCLKYLYIAVFNKLCIRNSEYKTNI